jgi:uncharacterized protein with PQ loop repeat
MEFIGYIGSICLAICGFPQCLLSIKQGHSEGISLNFLILWTLGELFTLLYIVPKKDLPLIVNYSANLVFLGIIWKYKCFPVKKD